MKAVSVPELEPQYTHTFRDGPPVRFVSLVISGICHSHP
jgi:hypothetical protein